MTKLCFEKFKRGQIWIIKKDKDESIRGIRDRNNHIIEKSRPWLIVSNDISNKNSPILNCVPVTSRVTKHLPCHVTVNMDKGMCDIQCEQITTLNQSDFEDAIYIGTINEDIMQKIEISLANQLGLSIQIPSLETLEAFITKLANAKAEEAKSINTQVTSEYVESMVDRLSTIFNIPSTNIVSVENSADSIKSEGSMICEETPKPNSTANKSNKPSTYKKWTEESMIKFLQDSEKLSTEEMSKKYNMSMKAIYSNKYRFKIKLNK